MSPREIAAHALGVRGDDVLSIEALKHGLTNESWLVRTSNEAVVVRMSNRNVDSLQIDRVAESKVLDAVAAAGIGPPVIARDLDRGMLVTRYLGPTCEPAQLGEPAYIERLAAVLKRLHAVPAPRGIREIHLPAVIAGYLETLQASAYESVLIESTLSANALRRAAEIGASMTPCLCHNDVHRLNVIDGEPLRLLDWEYAGVGDPFFDLASLSVYEEYSPAQRRQLLQAYLGAVAAADIERLAECCWLFEYVRCLWLEVRAAVDGGAG